MSRPSSTGRRRLPTRRLALMLVAVLGVALGGLAVGRVVVGGGLTGDGRRDALTAAGDGSGSAGGGPAAAGPVSGVQGSTDAGAPGTGLPSPAGRYTAPDLRQRIDLAGGWRFLRADTAGAQATTFDDSAWTSVDVPHTWNAVDGADGGGDYYRGTGWYRRHFAVPANLAGRSFVVEFDGVNQVADVWLNGSYAGQHRGGYSRFRFSVTAATRTGGDNVIAVRVNNALDRAIAPLSGDYTFDGGIYRGVRLWAVDPLQIRLLDYAGPGVYLRTRSVNNAAATVDVTTRLFNNGSASRSVTVRTVITDADSRMVADQTIAAQRIDPTAGLDVVQTVTIPRPHRWNGVADPYQYRAHVELRDIAANRLTDVVSEPLGLRTFAVNPVTGFSLNGHPLPLHGVNLHQDRGTVGWAVNDIQRQQDLRMVKEMGANAIRMAHYQHDQRDYALADEMGFVIWAEIPLIDAITDSAAFTANSAQQLRELIRQNYNHPSIVFWGIGNEQRVDDTATNNLLDLLAGIVTTEDPDRLSTYAHCCLTTPSPVAAHAETSGFNKYYGWYTGSSDELGGWLDYLHESEPSRPIGLSEYGAGASISQHALNPDKPVTTSNLHPEEYQAALHEASWKQIEARTYLWGSFVWNMFDFASDSRDEGGQPGINDKGLVTRDRSTRKDAFYWYKANWADTPTLYVTSRRWTERTDPLTEIKVYSSATSVSATLNGISLGAVTSDDHIFRWTGVRLTPGRNSVTVVATIGGETITDNVVWNFGPTAPRNGVGD